MRETAFRIRIITAVVLIFAFFLFVKLYIVQVVEHNDFADRANRQYIHPVGSVFDRGTVFFKDKGGTYVAAASLKEGYTVAINPKILKDPEDAYTKLAVVIKDLSHDDFIARATKPNDSYEEVAKRIDPSIADMVTSLGIAGVNVYKEVWRYYPDKSLASQVLGFVGFNNDGKTLSGRYGLEKFYDSTLKRDTQDVYVNFFAEIFSGIHKTLTDRGTTEGDIYTTIEPNVQQELEKELLYVQDQYSSEISGGIVMDPNTGEIIAMAANPTFDVNNFQSVSDQSVFINPMVQSVYEMGSIFKPLTMAAGIDAGVITASSTYNDAGHLTLNGRTIYNYDLRARGPGTTMQQVLNESLNVGAAFVERKLGNKQFMHYIENYGITQKTGIDLPNEVSPLVGNFSTARDIEFATASFGQGLAVSPIQMTRALAVLANGGKLVTPRVVNKIDYKVGFTRDIPITPPLQVIKPETSKAISKMLTNVVDNALLVGAVKLDHYSTAAKTGTAQIVDPTTNKYYKNQYLHSFFGYFPTNNPRFLVFLYTYKPQGVEYASHTLTLPFSDIEKFLINYYELPPDR
jgi:cell division protein FtsI/penicillin-binding protein 2